jgi:hypothetical protein
MPEDRKPDKVFRNFMAERHALGAVPREVAAEMEKGLGLAADISRRLGALEKELAEIKAGWERPASQEPDDLLERIVAKLRMFSLEGYTVVDFAQDDKTPPERWVTMVFRKDV